MIRRGTVIPRHEDEYFADTWCAIHLGLQLPSREAGKCGLARWLCLSLGVIGFECCPLHAHVAKPTPLPPTNHKIVFFVVDRRRQIRLLTARLPDGAVYFGFDLRAVSAVWGRRSEMRPGVLVEPPFGVWWPGTPSEKSLQCAARVSATTGGANIRVKVMESGALMTKKMASVDVHCRATPCDGCYVPHVVGPRW